MRQICYTTNNEKRYFHEVIEEEEKILPTSKKQSRLHKNKRQDKEKVCSELLREALKKNNANRN